MIACRLQVVLLMLLLLSGCAHSLVIYAPSLLPARVPVQVFPSVWVVGRADQDEGYLLDRLATQLAQEPKREVRRLDPAQLKAARDAGQVPAVTVVLQLTLSVSSGTHDFMDTTPVQYCGPFGCSVQYQSYINAIAQVTGNATISVQEGPSPRELQSERFVVTLTGEDELALQNQLWEQMANKLSQAVAIVEVKEPFQLYESKLPEAEQGVALLARGQWQQGRARLELAARQLGGRDALSQAQVWYDLGIARMLAPGPAGLSAQAVAAAQRALDWAERLAPNELHRQASRRLAEAYKRGLIVAAQQRAQQHNFGLVTGG